METVTHSALTSTGTTPDNQSEFEQGESTRWNEQPSNENESLLPPTDTGKDAWLFVAASFTVEMMVWGKCGKLHLLDLWFCYTTERLC
jgi:hypothetical protein